MLCCSVQFFQFSRSVSRMHVPPPTHTHTHTRARTHARTHARTPARPPARYCFFQLDNYNYITYKKETWVTIQNFITILQYSTTYNTYPPPPPPSKSPMPNIPVEHKNPISPTHDSIFSSKNRKHSIV